jgi:predicted RNase H-like HicB family nuclease
MHWTHVKGIRAMRRLLHCYAEGRDGEWEAICLDLDVAVQGHSFTEVYESLDEAITLYLASVHDLPSEERARLLHRPVPLRVRLGIFVRLIRALIMTNRHPRDPQRAEFTLAVAA